MYEFLGLKHVFSTFQETVWSHLKNVCQMATFVRKTVLKFDIGLVYSTRNTCTQQTPRPFAEFI